MTKEKISQTRRTEGVRIRGRAERIVDSILQATAEQLAVVGFAALRIEDVASRSGVNKTTIYRRWPTRSSLVEAALRRVKGPLTLPDTGSLRDDLLAFSRYVLTFLETPVGVGLIRVIQTERLNPEFEPIARGLRIEHRAARIALIERAIERGELPKGTRADIIADLVFIPIMTKCVSYGEPVDEDYLSKSIDIVLAGAVSAQKRN